MIDNQKPRVNRRTVLQSGALVAVGLTVAGCQQSPRGATEPHRGPATVPASHVPVGGGIVIPDANFVVTQPEAGMFKAFVKICPHGGCAVTKVQNQLISCPCHRSEFSIIDGSVMKGPAKAGLGKAQVTPRGDSLEISA